MYSKRNGIENMFSVFLSIGGKEKFFKVWDNLNPVVFL